MTKMNKSTQKEDNLEVEFAFKLSMSMFEMTGSDNVSRLKKRWTCVKKNQFFNENTNSETFVVKGLIKIN